MELCMYVHSKQGKYVVCLHAQIAMYTHTDGAIHMKLVRICLRIRFALLHTD